jgi:hypothetical protein
MSEELVQFGTRSYAILFFLLVASRGVDLLSTGIATPNLVLEGNPIARKLGWTWGLVVNLGFCFGFAFWPLPAVVISTTSVLVAARNLQSAWLMRSMGEHCYRDWHIQRIQETGITLYLFCLFGQTALTAAVGAAVIYFANWEGGPVLPGIGMGIVAYAVAVAYYTLLGVWRLRRAGPRDCRLADHSGPAGYRGARPGESEKFLTPFDS